MPKASIIITCYNLGLFLEEALGSALAQTYSDFEVVLIDDGSTDPTTTQLLDRLPEHPRLRVLRTANQGVARARNYAIGQSGGEYILPLDADDRLLPEYLSSAIRLLDADPSIGFVGAHYRIFGDRAAECRPEAYRLPDLLVENVVPIASVLRRSCWEQVGGYCPELNSIEDWDLWVSILERGFSAKVLPEILFEYRVRPNSNLAHIRNPDTYQERMGLFYQRHWKLFDQYQREVLIAKDRQFANLHSYAAWLEQQARNWERAAQEQQQLITMLQQPKGFAGRSYLFWLKQEQYWLQIRERYPSRRALMRAIVVKSLRAAKRRANVIYGFALGNRIKRQ